MIIGKIGRYSKKYYYVYARFIYRYDGKIIDRVVKNAPFRTSGELNFLAALMAKTRYKSNSANDIAEIVALLQDYERWETKAEISFAIFKKEFEKDGKKYKPKDEIRHTKISLKCPKGY